MIAVYTMHTLLLVLLLLHSTHSVSITLLSVPRGVQLGTDSVILDCQYTYKDTEADQLRVRWFYNQDPSPFFQWMAGTMDSKPQVIGSMFEDKIDLSYMVTTDQHTRHRAIMINQPSIEMAGTYRCVVDTVTSEAVAEANMLVYSPVKETQFTQKRLGDWKVNVSCQFSGVYPVPDVRLSLGSVQLVEDGRHTHGGHHGYHVAVWKLFVMEDLARDTHVRLGCRMVLPGTGYVISLYGGVGRERGEEISEEEDDEVEHLVITVLRICAVLAFSFFVFYTCRFSCRRFTLRKPV